MNDKYVLTRNKTEVSVLCQTTDQGNLDAFSLDCATEEDALILLNQLDAMVRMLNEQDRELRKLGIDLP